MFKIIGRSVTLIWSGYNTLIWSGYNLYVYPNIILSPQNFWNHGASMKKLSTGIVTKYNQEVQCQTFSLVWFGFVFFPLFATWCGHWYHPKTRTCIVLTLYSKSLGHCPVYSSPSVSICCMTEASWLYLWSWRSGLASLILSKSYFWVLSKLEHFNVKGCWSLRLCRE